MITNYEEIDVQRAREVMAQESPIIVDIRDATSFEEAHIPQAIPVNDNNIEQFLTETDKTRTLLCYCYHGFSSQTAAEYFRQNGFARVFSITGGFEQWRQTFPEDIVGQAGG